MHKHLTKKRRRDILAPFLSIFPVRPLLVVATMIMTGSTMWGGNEPEHLHVEDVQEIIQRAITLHVASDRYWRRLLHYRGNRSEAQSGSFFLAPSGHFDPEAELAATISGSFQPQDEDNPDVHVRCRFPERIRFLRERIDLPDNPVACRSLNLFRERIPVRSVSVVFASYYMNAPASMFGHTLLKLNLTDNRQVDLLNFAVNFAATPGEIGMLRYLVGGLSGGYPGAYALMPYHLKVKEYNDNESRDLWEYRLALSAEQIERMMNHIWELDTAQFPYYYIDGNCSYHLLSLIEVARPELDLRARAGTLVLPAETIKAIQSEPGLVSKIVYRPSLYSSIRQALAVLSPEEREAFYAGRKSIETMVESEPWRSLPPERRAFVVDTLLSASRYTEDRKSGTASDESFRALLRLRTSLPGSDTPELPEESYSEARTPDSPLRTPLSDPPHVSHSVYLLRTSAGSSSIGPFAQLQYRVAYHDVMNADRGLAANTAFEWLNLSLRSYDGRGTHPSLWVQDFTLLKIASLAPYESLNRSFSYIADAGVESRFDRIEANDPASKLIRALDPTRPTDPEPLASHASYIDAVLGPTLALGSGFPHDPSLSFSTLAGMRIENSIATQKHLQPAASGTALMVLTAGPMKFQVGGKYIRYQSGKDEERGFASFRFEIAQNHQIQLEAGIRKSFRDALLSYSYQF